jgi:hypothetical protein
VLEIIVWKNRVTVAEGPREWRPTAGVTRLGFLSATVVCGKVHLSAGFVLESDKIPQQLTGKG